MIVNYNIIKKSSSKFRMEHGLGEKDPINIKSLLIKLKVLAIFKPIKSDFSGMAIRTDYLRFLLINSNNSIGRQNYTVIHELYHLFVQENFNSSICYSESNKKNTIDKIAESFASVTLLPEQGVLDMIPDQEIQKNKISVGTILEMEHYFMCSRAALLSRLKSLLLIDDQKYSEYNRDIIRDAEVYGYDISLYKPGNHNLVIGDYGKLAKILFDKNAISESHYMSLMNDIGVAIGLEENYK